MLVVLQNQERNSRLIFQYEDIITKKTIDKCLSAAILQLKKRSLQMPNEHQGHLFTVFSEGSIIGYGIVKVASDESTFQQYAQEYPHYSFALTPKEETYSAGVGIVHG